MEKGGHLEGLYSYCKCEVGCIYIIYSYGKGGHLASARREEDEVVFNNDASASVKPENDSCHMVSLVAGRDGDDDDDDDDVVDDEDVSAADRFFFI